MEIEWGVACETTVQYANALLTTIPTYYAHEQKANRGAVDKCGQQQCYACGPYL